MVGRAVTKNLPLNPGESVTSIFAVFIFKCPAHIENSSQVDTKFLQAGHHGA